MITPFRTFVLAAMVVACSKQEPPAPAATTAPSATAPAASAAPAPSTTTPAPSASAATAEPPTEEDFENEATDQVTAKTLDAQLDALEKEIKAD